MKYRPGGRRGDGQQLGPSGSAIVNPLADINADGKVDLFDLAIVAKNYNKTSSAYNSWKP